MLLVREINFDQDQGKHEHAKDHAVQNKVSANHHLSPLFFLSHPHNSRNRKKKGYEHIPNRGTQLAPVRRAPPWIQVMTGIGSAPFSRADRGTKMFKFRPSSSECSIPKGYVGWVPTRSSAPGTIFPNGYNHSPCGHEGLPGMRLRNKKSREEGGGGISCAFNGDGYKNKAWGAYTKISESKKQQIITPGWLHHGHQSKAGA